MVILNCSLTHKNRLQTDAGREIKLGTLGSKSHLIRVGYGFAFIITDAFNLLFLSFINLLTLNSKEQFEVLGKSLDKKTDTALMLLHLSVTLASREILDLHCALLTAAALAGNTAVWIRTERRACPLSSFKHESRKFSSRGKQWSD